MQAERPGMHPMRARLAGWLGFPLVLFLPLYFIPQTMFFGSWDGAFYVNMLALTQDAVYSGTWFPHWFADANAGFGSTVTVFYPLFSYVVTAFLEWPLRPLHPDAGEAFLTGIYLSQVVSGVTAWLWLRRPFPAAVAFIGSLLFVLLPYKFIYLYEHYNLAQLWALALLPLWMMTARRLVMHGGIASAVWYGLALSAVFYTHPITVLAFAAAPGCYCLWFGRRTALRTGLLLALAHLLAAGVCLAYAWPQAHYQPLITAQIYISGRASWRVNLYHIDLFLCAYYGLIALLMAYAAKRCMAMKEAGHAGESLFWSLAIAAVIFMNLPLSIFVWEHVPVLQYLQFPMGRLNAPALMGVTYLICSWLTHWRDLRALSPVAYRPVTLAGLVAVFAAATLWRVFAAYLSPTDLTQDYVNDVRAAHIIVPQEYNTIWGCYPADKALALYRSAKIPDKLNAEEGAHVTLKDWQPERIAFLAEIDAPDSGITVRQCYFPQWEAFDGGKPVDLSPSSPNGLIHLRLDRGSHRIELRYGASDWETFARKIRLFCLFLSASLIFASARPRQGSGA